MNQLNNDCLLAIFQHISLSKCLSLRQVSCHWKILIEAHRCRPMKSLKLFPTKKEMHQYSMEIVEHNLDHHEHLRFKPCGKDDVLLYGRQNYSNPKVNIKMSWVLADLFPNLQTLVIYRNNPTKAYLEKLDVEYLFAKWSPTLKCLCINTQLLIGYYHERKFWIDQFWHTHQDSLQSLHCLESLHHFGPLPQNTTFSSTIPQLKCFKFQMNKNISDTPLAQLKLDRLSQLWLEVKCINSLDQIVDLLINTNSGLLEKLTHLSIQTESEITSEPNIEVVLKILQQLSTRLISVQYLNLDFCYKATLDQIIPSLIQLPNLKELFLHVLSQCWFAPKDNFKLPRLPNVRTLHLVYHWPLYRLDRVAQSVAHLFPNIDRLSVDVGYYMNSEQLMRDAFLVRMPNCAVNVVPYIYGFKRDYARIMGQFE